MDKKGPIIIPRWTISTLVFWVLGIGLLAIFGTDFEEWEESLDFMGDLGAVLMWILAVNKWKSSTHYQLA